MKLFTALLATSGLVLGGLSVQSASWAQAAAGLSTSITTNNVTAAGVAADLTGTTSFEFAAGLTGGVAGSTATLCLGQGVASIQACYGGNEAVAEENLRGSGVVSADNDLLGIGAFAAGSTFEDISGSGVVVIFDGLADELVGGLPE